MNGYRCARCGYGIEVYEYMQNVALIKVLGIFCGLHFCDKCLEIIKNDEL